MILTILIFVATLLIGSFLYQYLFAETFLDTTVEVPSFAEHIRHLFRPFDVASMKIMGLDLSQYEEVKGRGSRIYQRVAAGTMPCDGAWSAAKVNLFKRWIETGMQP